MLKPVATATALTLLASCGSLSDDDAYRQVFEAGRNLLDARRAEAAAAGNRIDITRAMIDQLPGDVLVVESYEGTNRVLMVPAVVNLNRVSWLSEDNVSVVTENGLIVATRGLPRDLMAADVIESRRAILNGGGQVTRTHETLSDRDQILTELLQCSIALQEAEMITIVQTQVPTVRFTETCEGEHTAFTNTYWTDATGTIARSDQWISAEVGSLVLERP